jgi:ArsR family transcriptional regulator
VPAKRPVLGPLPNLQACCEPLSAEVPDENESAAMAAAFRALGDPVRLRLLGLLLTDPGGEVCACDVVAPLGRSQPTVSHHLKVLREAGWISGERRGTWIWYSLRPEAVVRFRRLAAQIEAVGARPATHLGPPARGLTVVEPA